MNTSSGELEMLEAVKNYQDDSLDFKAEAMGALPPAMCRAAPHLCPTLNCPAQMPRERLPRDEANARQKAEHGHCQGNPPGLGTLDQVSVPETAPCLPFWGWYWQLRNSPIPLPIVQAGRLFLATKDLETDPPSVYVPTDGHSNKMPQAKTNNW